VLALSARCPLRGCTLFWRDGPGSEFPDAPGFFRCPCCGSVFTRAGIDLFGPAPRPLNTLAVRVRRDGSLLVDMRVVLRGWRDNALRVARCGRVC
jgi:cytochrome b6-f complex iron-sulfur subunit